MMANRHKYPVLMRTIEFWRTTERFAIRIPRHKFNGYTVQITYLQMVRILKKIKEGFKPDHTWQFKVDMTTKPKGKP